MKLLYPLFILLILTSTIIAGEQKMIPRYNRLTGTWTSYPEVSVQWIQEVHQDSLIIADSIQNVQARWKLQTSDHLGDTVVVTGLVLVPAKVITYTAKGFTMLLRDTSDIQSWGGLLVRVNYSSSTGGDTSAAIADGFMNPEAGDIVKITGLISEYPINTMNSATQFQPVKGYAIEIIGNKALPIPISKNVSDFYNGKFPGGKVSYSKGEPYEGMIVELTNLTIDGKVNLNRGTFSMVDGSNNQITMLDASKYFTLAGGVTDHPYPDPVWTSIYNSPSFVNTKIDTIRGFITINSGTEAERGYRICPIYYGDIKFGKVYPTITTHRRYPVVVPSDSTPLITVKAYTYALGKSIKSTVLYYSVNNGPFVADTMALNVPDTTYSARIPQQPEGTFVRYFIEAVDTDVPSNSMILASSAYGGAMSDTSQGFFFYYILNRPLTIHDVQYTPFSNGRTAYLGAVVTVGGIVTADTASLSLTPASGGTSVWYMQSGNTPFNGIWMVGPDTIMKPLHNGDSVIVTGTVAENYDVTRLQYVSSAVIVSNGNPIPSPVILNTGNFGPTTGNGNLNAEPWEGMLVRFNNVTVSNLNPTYSDPSEYQVDDGSEPVIVQHGGKNKYSNIAADTILGKTILKLGDHISSLTGIIYYSYNFYKFVPRTDDDFGTITDVKENGYNLLPSRHNLSQNYPNPFNPSTKFDVTLPQTSRLQITVFNLLGQKVATLVDEVRSAGTYTLAWNGLNQNGLSMNTGVYFVKMQTDNFSIVRKVLLVK